MTSNFSTLVNNQSFAQIYERLPGEVIHRQKLLSTLVHFENFKLRDQRLVVVHGGECRVINSRSLLNFSVSLLNGTFVF